MKKPRDDDTLVLVITPAELRRLGVSIDFVRWQYPNARVVLQQEIPRQ